MSNLATLGNLSSPIKSANTERKHSKQNSINLKWALKKRLSSNLNLSAIGDLSIFSGINMNNNDSENDDNNTNVSKIANKAWIRIDNIFDELYEFPKQSKRFQLPQSASIECEKETHNVLLIIVKLMEKYILVKSTHELNISHKLRRQLTKQHKILRHKLVDNGIQNLDTFSNFQNICLMAFNNNEFDNMVKKMALQQQQQQLQQLQQHHQLQQQQHNSQFMNINIHQLNNEYSNISTRSSIPNTSSNPPPPPPRPSITTNTSVSGGDPMQMQIQMHTPDTVGIGMHAPMTDDESPVTITPASMAASRRMNHKGKHRMWSMNATALSSDNENTGNNGNNNNSNNNASNNNNNGSNSDNNGKTKHGRQRKNLSLQARLSNPTHVATTSSSVDPSTAAAAVNMESDRENNHIKSKRDKLRDKYNNKQKDKDNERASAKGPSVVWPLIVKWTEYELKNGRRATMSTKRTNRKDDERNKEKEMKLTQIEYDIIMKMDINIIAHVFDEVTHSIANLMKDSLTRFKTTTEFEKWAKKHGYRVVDDE